MLAKKKSLVGSTPVVLLSFKQSFAISAKAKIFLHKHFYFFRHSMKALNWRSFCDGKKGKQQKEELVIWTYEQFWNNFSESKNISSSSQTRILFSLSTLRETDGADVCVCM